MAKTTKKSSRKVKVTSGFSMTSLLGLALLLGLLCVLPWASGLNGGVLVRTTQLSLALLLALGGGFCLGYQLAANRKK